MKWQDEFLQKSALLDQVNSQFTNFKIDQSMKSQSQVITQQEPAVVKEIGVQSDASSSKVSLQIAKLCKDDEPQILAEKSEQKIVLKEVKSSPN